MPRPHMTSRLSLPPRIKSYTGGNGASNPPSRGGSRAGSPERNMPGERQNGLVLRIVVVKGRNLAAKDKSGTSDPYLVLTLGNSRQSTPSIPKNLNPEWNQTIDLPITTDNDVLLEAVCWDKDRFRKDYMGEFDIPLEDIFANGKTLQEPKWYRLESRKSGKKNSVVTGEILLQFSIYDPVHTSATSQQLLQKFMGMVATSPDAGEDDDIDDEELARLETQIDEEDEEGDEKDGVGEERGEALSGDSTSDPVEKRKKRAKIARIRRRMKQRAYEFTGSSNLAGVLFLEITRIEDLPPERNMTRTGFDMDPFVVTSLGRKTFRTRVVRHNLNPVYEEKLVFQVMKHETNYSASFAVVDKDKFSNNDFVGTVNFALDNVISIAPEADPTTGLFNLKDPPSEAGPVQRKQRFRLGMSRSSSATSLTRMNKPSLKKESSSGSLSGSSPEAPSNYLAPGPTSAPLPPDTAPTNGNGTSIPTANVDQNGMTDDMDLRKFSLPLDMKNKDRWETKHSPVLYIKAKYLPYLALRQQFWRAMLRQYDADDSGLIDKVELTTMLDSLGSTLHESTIDGFFNRFAAENNNEGYLTFDQAVFCLEDQLQKDGKAKSPPLRPQMPSIPATSSSSVLNIGENEASGTSTPALSSSNGTPINNRSQTSVIPALETDKLGRVGEEGGHLETDDLTDDRSEEHVIEIRECPICHQPRLNRRTDADIITHIATCASQDWRQVNNIVMAGFVTSSQAQRKWYSKVITKISYGGYRLGANSANILVQDRMTGQINEERMSVYVRLGIRLLYKGLKSREMEKKNIRKLLRSLSIKQGKKYDDPASAAEIEGFINFHQLNMNEVLLNVKDFKNFNEFFYRALKPDARPCSAPDDPSVIVSPADCRCVVFNELDEAQKIWVKGRDFTVERLLGDAYPQDAKRYKGGALGVYRLAPQDYHRFHIPVDGVMGEPKLIAGEYYTVNPMAIRSALDVYGENIRVIVPIDSVKHGRVMVVCVGAMMVGSTVITRKAGEKVARAEELGYFKFGGSTILLLFEPGVMKWDQDLVDNSLGALETLVRVGMSVGHSPDREPHRPDMKKAQGDITNEDRQEAKRRIEGSLAPPSSGDGAREATAGI